MASNLKQTIRKCVYLVRCGHFWSRDKMTVTPFDPPLPKTPRCTRKLHGSVFYSTGRPIAVADRSFTLRE